jgi:hypothetical protein
LRAKKVKRGTESARGASAEEELHRLRPPWDLIGVDTVFLLLLSHRSRGHSSSPRDFFFKNLAERTWALAPGGGAVKWLQCPTAHNFYPFSHIF